MRNRYEEVVSMVASAIATITISAQLRIDLEVICRPLLFAKHVQRNHSTASSHTLHIRNRCSEVAHFVPEATRVVPRCCCMTRVQRGPFARYEQCLSCFIDGKLNTYNPR